ncbi:MAG: DUF1552 domain-containing protein [Gemmatimonadota bacterium]|nr:hypothetical protein [Gemmatimonadota bacterium]MEC9241906.1 DUF1552 domain-containing protein [Gemmatimonadota bacterium]MEC9299173.1 DUF1552 domain-containing protein [Gemmatimonadota bacterium]MED5563283.1 DUF1552 domain-containing protein [Gemmatimonadota bacterium]MEE3185505.1 DUF1552 domain-containing protein [Gemmatimonadota bacterium]|tara:strand:+ start:78 stop:1412 length:1335 start_codon:yes stop_codon:yes gene_type:complete
MIITKKAIPRRTMLKGLGASLALPLLDGMVPAFTALRDTAADPVRRLGIVYVPNGMMMDHWTPATEGIGFNFPTILQPLERFRDQVEVLSGMHGVDAEGPHARASTRFLTGVASQRDDGSNLKAGISMDQIAGRVLGQETQLATLELAIDGRDFAGSCDEGFSCAYTNTISWANDTTPLPMENNPRAVFERLFGDSGSTDPAVRKARLEKDASLLDSVTDRARYLSRQLGSTDQAKLDQYLEAVRDIERRIQMAEAQSERELPVVDQPAGIPDTFGEHTKMMFDLLALAYETDLTRVATFMMGREITGRTYAEIGVPDAHHPISHHQRDPVKLEKLMKINLYHAELFAEFIARLNSTPDGDGTLLDHSMIVYGAGMADSNSHYSGDLPILLAGGAAGTGGRHMQHEPDTPLANLHLSLLDKMGVPIESLGDSTGRLPLETLSGV